MLDPKSNLKLYPRKSNNLVTTSANTQFHVPKEYVDYTQGFTISMDLYYDPATWNTSRYNSICGRGNNTGFHSGMFVPGLISGNNFMGSWRNASSYSTISTSGLTAAWYRFSMVVTTTTAQIKLLNLRTNVELSGNVISVGTVTNGDNLAFTFLSYGIDGYTGAYGSVGVNVSNITISRNGTCLLHIPLSSGADTKVVDICNKTQYTLGFFTSSIGWAKLSDYSHANFYYGYTLYTKSGSPNFYVCNAHDGTEIVPTVVPSGYTRVANYGPSRTAFNQCESKFKLDDVAEVSGDVLAVCPDSFYSSLYVRQNDELYISAANNCEISLSGGTWRFRNRTTYAIPYIITRTWPLINPALENWSVVGVTCSNPVIVSNLDLYTADPDHVLFTEGTGVAKEFDIGDIVVDDGVDRGYLYINETGNKDFLMYGTDKTLNQDVKVLKSIGYRDYIVYDENNQVVYDENDHATLS